MLFRGSLLDLVLLDVPLVALADTVTLPLELLVGTLLAPFVTDLAPVFFGATFSGAFTFLLKAALGAAVAVLRGLLPPFLTVERPFAAALVAVVVARWDPFFGPMAFFVTVRFAACRAPFVAGVRFLAMVIIGQVPR